MIGFILTYIKLIALFLAVVVLMQCCTVYSKEPVSIKEVIGHDQKKIKVVTTYEKEFVFNSIYYKGDNLYGQLHWDKQEILLAESSIKGIFLVNGRKSRLMTALLIVSIPIGAIAYMGIMYTMEPGFDLGWDGI